MNDEDLTRLSIIVIIVGLVIIFVAALVNETPVVHAGDLTLSMSGEQISVCGKITKVVRSEKGTVFLDILDGSGSVSVVFFPDSVKALGLDVSEGHTGCVSGTVDASDGEVGLVGRTIRGY